MSLNLLLTVLFLCTCASGQFQSRSPRTEVNPKINQQTYAKINTGMTEREVVRILGCSWGKHFSGTVSFSTAGARRPIQLFYGDKMEPEYLLINWSGALEKDHPFHVTKGWIGNEYGIWITFSKQGKVVSKGIHPVQQIKK